MMDTALKQDSLNTTDILELESLTIDGLNFIFPKSSHDVVVKNLRQRAECNQWSCISCTYQFHKNISCTSEHISRIVHPHDGFIVDVGCYIGTVALPLAKMGFSVLAIDGSQGNIECLERAVIKNDLYSIQAIETVVSNSEYMCDFSSDTNPYNSIQVGSMVQTTTLDKVLENIQYKSVNDNTQNVPCSFIKIDVEGYEKEVLEGSIEMLTTYHPSICLEINTHLLHKRDMKPRDIFSYLDNLSYELYLVNIVNPTMPYLQRFEPTNQFPFSVENVLALHKDYKKSNSLHIPIGDDWTHEDSDNLLNTTLTHILTHSPFYDYMINLSNSEG